MGTITQQEKDATEALNGQTSMQQKMLDHQYTTQKELIKAEYERNITMATNQFAQQRDQSILEAEQQRMMAISQQAASMQAQAQQYKLQMEMQQKMSTLYSGAGATGTKGATATKTK